ncbi:MAG: PHP domain-containing protein [Christensenellaceae bacterium]|jgi:PHP family Zn ribbon phosphoesterase|nr:PHP domain-containing protein [Christensenellaceae bacterium]
MRIAVDLHIHSCLSPCADNDMTPWNIVGMAKVKGLDAVAICDHNSVGNLRAALKAGAEYGVCVVPGMEVTSREDIHLLCYFPTLAQALQMQARVEDSQPFIQNKAALFGEQILVDEDDNRVGQTERLLLTACELTLTEIAALAQSLGGVMVPAHINKGANSLLPILGFMPEEPSLPTVEIYGMQPHSALGRLCITSSDAHQLCDILEQGYELLVEEVTPQGIIQALKLGQAQSQ